MSRPTLVLAQPPTIGEPPTQILGSSDWDVKYYGVWVTGRIPPRFSSLDTTWCIQVLRSPKEAFAAAMQSWRERCEKCVCLQGDYVEK